ncbi:MAG: glycosyltransferase family 2 protein [Candidatus Eisenbacteria bacterium]
MPPSDVSVIIVSYNTRALLEQCLGSLPAAASPLTLQAIVVDNGSSDGSVELVRTDFPEVLCLENPGNPGFAHATNRGLELATGLVWVWLNSDCECPAGSLAGLVAALADHPEAGAVGPRLVYGDGRIQPSAQNFPGVSRVLIHFLGLRALANWAPARGLLQALSPFLGRMTRGYLEAIDPHANERSVDWLSGACVATRPEAARVTGPLDEGYFMYCEDTDWCHRLKDAGWDIRWTPQVTITHHVGGSGGNSSLATYHYYRSLLRYFARYESQSLVLLRVFMLGGCLVRGAAAELGRMAGAGPHPWWRLWNLAWQGPRAWETRA